MNRTLIAIAMLVLLALGAPIGLGTLVLPVQAQDEGGDSQSDDAGDQTDTDDTAPPPPANPGKPPPAAAAPGTVLPVGTVVPCVEGKPCFKDLTLGGPIKQRLETDLWQK